MADLILVDGDQATFLPAFGVAVVTPRPGKLAGSGGATFGGKKLCIVGDERSVAVDGCIYMTPLFSIPGKGTLRIAAVGANQKAKITRSGQKPVLLKGASFTAKLEVKTPAQQPQPTAPPILDPTPQYSGSGMFITTNSKLRGT